MYTRLNVSIFQTPRNPNIYSPNDFRDLYGFSNLFTVSFCAVSCPYEIAYSCANLNI